MAEDCILKLKTNNGHIVQVGDMGKTMVRPLGDIASADDMEVNFFYARDYTGEDGNALGEIRNIQVEPEWDGDVSKLNAGDAFAYSTPDLLGD